VEPAIELDHAAFVKCLKLSQTWREMHDDSFILFKCAVKRLMMLRLVTFKSGHVARLTRHPVKAIGMDVIQPNSKTGEGHCIVCNKPVYTPMLRACDGKIFIGNMLVTACCGGLVHADCRVKKCFVCGERNVKHTVSNSAVGSLSIGAFGGMC
jgi:hypothetical protein